MYVCVYIYIYVYTYLYILSNTSGRRVPRSAPSPDGGGGEERLPLPGQTINMIIVIMMIRMITIIIIIIMIMIISIISLIILTTNKTITSK